MARLPLPGSDDGVWGDVLNEYLQVEHNDDGTHKPAAVVDASTSSKGKVRLAGDLGGTADSPSVVKVNGITVSGTPSNGHVLTANTASTASWQAAASGFADPTTTKGDLIVRATGSTTRLPIGSDNQVLTADAAQTSGVKWATPATVVTDHTALSNIGTNTHSQIDSHIASTANPHSVTKSQVGLANVDNTSDANKPVSAAAQTALDLKANLASPTFTGNLTVPTVKITGGSPGSGKVLTSDADGDAIWVTPTSGGTASGTTFTPAGNIIATDVQAALVELDNEKAALAYYGTFASFPAASSNTGRLAVASNMGNGTPYVSNGTTWLQAGAAVQAPGGVSLASTELTSDYSIMGQAAPTIYTDVDWQITIGISQSVAYEVTLDMALIASWSASFATGAYVVALIRVVDSLESKVLMMSSVDWIGNGAGNASGTVKTFSRSVQVPAGHPAVSWKVQVKLQSAAPTGLTALLIYAGPAFPAVSGAQIRTPAQLRATTVS